MGAFFKKLVLHSQKILYIIDRKGVVPFKCIALQRSLEKTGQYLWVLSIWPCLHFKRFDVVERIGCPIVLSEIEWAVRWQSDSRKIIKGIIDQTVLGLGEVLDSAL